MAFPASPVFSVLLALLLCAAHADRAQNAASKSIAAVRNSITVVKSVANPGNQAIIKTCIKVLDDSVVELNETVAALKARNAGVARMKALDALDDVETCNDAFSGSRPLPVHSALTAAESSIRQLVGAIKQA